MNSPRDDTEAGTGRSGLLRRTLVTIAVLALAGVALYAAAGLWIAPRVFERELRATAREGADLDLAAEIIAVNPFTLALSLHNVTLFRGESTPVVTIGRLEGRIGGIDPAARAMTLREVIVRSLDIADRQGRPLLAVPRATADLLVLGSDAAPVAIGTPRLERPHLHLRSGPGGALELPEELSFLLDIPPAAGDSELTLEVSGASLDFGADRSASVLLRLGNIDGSIGRRRAGSEIIANASLRSRTPGVGNAQVTGEWLPLRPRDRTLIELTLGDFDLSVISPWLASMFGRAPRSGRADVEMLLEIESFVLRLDTAMTVENLRFAPGAEDVDAAAARREADMETAIALLEEADGRMTLDVPAVRRRLAARTKVADVVASSLTDYVTSLAASPFEYLAGLVEWPGPDLGRLGFQAGSAEIGDESAAKLEALERALDLRPELALTVFPALDENADREALARQQILLHVNLASSAGMPGEPAPASLDYDDPVVRDVLEEFAANRLSASRRDALAERYPGKSPSYYRAVFEALVDNETVATPTLVRLARYRAQAVADVLAAREDDDRIRQAEEIVLAAPGRGPEVTLEVRRAAASPTRRAAPNGTALR